MRQDDVAEVHQRAAGTERRDRSPSTGRRDKLALVFQEYSRSLFPWMNVRQNVAFPLRGVKKAEARAIVEASLASVGLEGAMDRYPWQLSGGMQQRVAIARALAYQPSILLMDEPFASVDAQTRADLEDLVLQVRREYDVTILFVTHDIDESVYLSDRIVVLSGAPTRVQEVLDVPLPQPRDQVATKELPEFAALRAHVWRSIKRPEKVVGDLMLQHVALEVAPDTVEDCVAFWALLGFERADKPPRLQTSSTWVAREGTQIHLFPEDEPAIARKGHVAVVAPDYERVVLALSEAGYTVPRGRGRVGRPALHRPRSRRAHDRDHVRTTAMRYSPS